MNWIQGMQNAVSYIEDNLTETLSYEDIARHAYVSSFHFPCIGAMPKALQDVNGKIWSEWLPNCKEYELDGNLNIEMYTAGDINSPEYYSEIWIPVKKKG